VYHVDAPLFLAVMEAQHHLASLAVHCCRVTQNITYINYNKYSLLIYTKWHLLNNGL